MTQAHSKLSAAFAKPDEFAQFVEQRILGLDLAETVEISGPLQLRVDGELFDLENLWRVVKEGNEKTLDDVNAYLLGVFAENPLDRAPFEFVEKLILPRIMSRTLFELDPKNAKIFPHMPFPNDTVVVYTVEQKGHLVPVKADHAQNWGVDAANLHEIACANLGEASDGLTLGLMNVPRNMKAITISEPDGFSAERILLPDLHDRLSGKFSGEFYVAVSNRQRMVVLNGQDSGELQEQAAIIRRDFANRPNPVSDRLFSTGPDGVAPALIN